MAALFTSPKTSTAKYLIQQVLEYYANDSDVGRDLCKTAIRERGYRMPVKEMQKLFRRWQPTTKTGHALDYILGDVSGSDPVPQVIFLECWEHLNSQQRGYILDSIDGEQLVGLLEEGNYFSSVIDLSSPGKTLAFFMAIQPFVKDV